MLNGVAPLLIFNFRPALLTGLIGQLAGIPLIGDTLSDLVGIPVPLYLDENLTGIAVESETKAIDITTNVQARTNGPPSVDQAALNNLVTINMVSTTDSVVLAVLVALNEQIFSRVVAKTYNINYFNGTTTIFGGLLHGFSTNVSSDNNQVRITLQISKAPSKSTTPTDTTFVLPPITGSIPVRAP